MEDCDLKEDRAEPPGSSCPSMRSDRSRNKPPDFSEEPGPSEWSKRSSVGEEEQQSCCALCQKVLVDPVSTSCGHWFCRQCITSYQVQSAPPGPSSCPQCGKRPRGGAGLLAANQSSCAPGKMASGMIERAALGRPFTLGMLYDARKDQLILGTTLWDDKTLQKMTEENSQHGSEFRISASDSLEEKFSLLDVSDSLKTSFLGGLIEVGGSAKYLNDQKKSKNQSRVTFQYKATTIFKQLKISTEEMNKTQQIGVNVKSCATHVVTGISYGANAFFVLDSEKLDASSAQDIKGNIQAVINKISSLSASGEADLKLSDTEKAVTEKFTWKFYGDVIPESNPVTFEEAVKSYRKVPELLEKNKENTVPVKVWMMPLKNFDPSAAEMATDLSPGLVRKVQKAREDFHKLNIRCNDCLEGSFGFPKIKERLESFQQQCKIYEGKLLDVIAKKIPSIRAGEEDEKELLKILDDSEKSPFSSENLMKWMINIEREVSVITSCLKQMKGAKIVQSEAELVEEFLNPEVQDVLSFVFTSLETTDPYLDKMKDYLDSQAMKASEDMDQSINNLIPFPQADLLKMTRKAEEFGTFVKGLKNNKKFRFLVAAIKNKQHEGATIYHYRNKRWITEDFSKPDVCDVEKATDRRDLIWYACDLTFDPDTINGHLTLSQGNKMLKNGDRQSYPDHLKRFDVLNQVLCQESLTGRHYWEVELSTDEGRDAAAAVCYRGIQRKSDSAWAGIGWNTLSWSLGHKWEPKPVLYAEHNSSVNFYPLPHTGCARLGVFLDWPGGTLSYYIVAEDKLSHIHTFHTRFSEPVYPCFKICSKNSYILLCF
ncbi:neoverrucotoxin subunit alpha-like isoform X2 [Fundulus heteroclitus]|nr:neoverrucotoxin subunit alpha-like isoform X2 [Fundulus heteroclitus]